MKTSNLSRITLLCGLALGIMVLWAGASPIAEGADSLIGGWWPYQGAMCCYDDTWDDCSNGQAVGVYGCNSHKLKILLVYGAYWGTPYPPTICSGPGLCPLICNSNCPNP